MRNFRRGLIVLIVVALLVSGSVTALAYTYISTFGAGLTISAGTAKCSGDLYAERASDTCSITLTLKKETSPGVWSSVTSWAASDTDCVALSKTKSVTSGYRYKVTLKGNINGETCSLDSPIKAY